MRNLTFAVIALATMAFAPAGAQTSRGTAADSAAILRLDSIWAHNYAVHDTATAARLMADDFYMISGNGNVKNKAAEMNDIRPAAGLRMDYFRTEQPVVRVHGCTAVVSGTAAWQFEMNGRTSLYRRRYSAVYVKGGPLGWQLVELQILNVPQPGQ